MFEKPCFSCWGPGQATLRPGDRPSNALVDLQRCSDLRHGRALMRRDERLPHVHTCPRPCPTRTVPTVIPPVPPPGPRRRTRAGSVIRGPGGPWPMKCRTPAVECTPCATGRALADRSVPGLRVCGLERWWRAPPERRGHGREPYDPRVVDAPPQPKPPRPPKEVMH